MFKLSNYITLYIKQVRLVKQNFDNKKINTGQFMDKDVEKKLQDLKDKRRYHLLNYDTEAHSELLERSKYLKQQGTILNDELESELRMYSIILTNHLHWEIRDQYMELLEQFTKSKIDIPDFRMKFLERSRSIEDVSDVLESNRVLLSPDEKSLDFADLLMNIADCCYMYSGQPKPFRNSIEMGSGEFRISVEKTYSQLKNFLKE